MRRGTAAALWSAVWVFFCAAVPAMVLSQSGSQSDITGPNPVELIPWMSSPTVAAEGPPATAVDAFAKSTVGGTTIDRESFERQIQQAETGVAIQALESYQAYTFGSQLDLKLFGEPVTVEEISRTLSWSAAKTRQRAAFLTVSLQTDRLELFLVTPGPVGETARGEPVAHRFVVPSVTRGEVLDAALRLYNATSNPLSPPTAYRAPARSLYGWLIEPIETRLVADAIDVLVFSLDDGLRVVPLDALYDGKRHLVEKWAVAVVPSFGLTDVGYRDVRTMEVMAMGAAELPDQPPLPAVPLELSAILETPWKGRAFLNERFTVEGFRAQNLGQGYGVIHLATHAAFVSGAPSQSYIQFRDRRLSLGEFRALAEGLGWPSSPVATVELLVLSACQTAFGEGTAELGFAGLAVEAGVKTALASRWAVSDLGTLALMSEYYEQLERSPLKATALRQTQLALLRGETRFHGNALRLSNGRRISLPPELTPSGAEMDLSHPFFWAAFAVIGNWS